VRPRIKRRRRGHDFQANHDRVAERALAGDVDLLIHGGDVFHRSRPVPSLVHQAFEPLHRVARLGTPVFVVPGNHERSRIPHPRRARHPGLHIFDRPRTVVVEVGGVRVAVSGFPYVRRDVRGRFARLVEATKWRHSDADIRILCVHHCVEGATVGPSDYVFRRSPDVVRGTDLPLEFAVVVSGHVHRQQTLERACDGRPLPTPWVYPGSIERTSVAEVGEQKGYVLLDLTAEGAGGRLERWSFSPLPTRPMVLKSCDLPPRGLTRPMLESWLDRTISETEADAVLRLRISGPLPPHLVDVLSASEIRRRAPATMNVEWSFLDEQGQRRRPRWEGPPKRVEQLSLWS